MKQDFAETDLSLCTEFPHNLIFTAMDGMNYM